jgi:hypothetical protein
MVRQVDKVCQDQRDHKVYRAHKVYRVHKAKRELLVLPVHKVRLESQASFRLGSI